MFSLQNEMVQHVSNLNLWNISLRILKIIRKYLFLIQKYRIAWSRLMKQPNEILYLNKFCFKFQILWNENTIQ